MVVLSDSTVRLRPCQGEAEYPALVSIWRSAVDATHAFVPAEELAEIERQLPIAYLPTVRLTVAELAGRPVGFAGVAGTRLEMLFVDDTVRGQGIGSALLARAMQTDRITELDVNEQNEDAVVFYTRRGFHVVGRSERDEAGRPYPLLHMQRE